MRISVTHSSKTNELELTAARRRLFVLGKLQQLISYLLGYVLTCVGQMSVCHVLCSLVNTLELGRIKSGRFSPATWIQVGTLADNEVLAIAAGRD